VTVVSAEGSVVVVGGPARQAGTVLRWRGADGAPTGVAGVDCALSVPRLRKLVAAG
jgi:hypothetical protein